MNEKDSESDATEVTTGQTVGAEKSNKGSKGSRRAMTRRHERRTQWRRAARGEQQVV